MVCGWVWQMNTMEIIFAGMHHQNIKIASRKLTITLRLAGELEPGASLI